MTSRDWFNVLSVVAHTLLVTERFLVTALLDWFDWHISREVDRSAIVDMLRSPVSSGECDRLCDSCLLAGDELDVCTL